MAEPFLTGARVYSPQGVQTRRLTLDTHGFVWVSGVSGTFRFDGVRYLAASRLGLPVHGEMRVAVTADGSIWAQPWANTEDALFRLDRGRFREMARYGTPWLVSSMVAAGELLYLPLHPTGLRVWYREGSVWKQASTAGPGPVIGLTGEPDGRVWFGEPSSADWVRWHNGKFEQGRANLLPSGRAVARLPGGRALNGDSREFRYEACGVWASNSAPALRLPGVRDLEPDFESGVWGARGDEGLIFAGRRSAVRMLSHQVLPDRPLMGVARDGQRLYVARLDRPAVLDVEKKALLCDGTDSRDSLLEAWGPPEKWAPFIDVKVDRDHTVWLLARNHGAIHLRPDGSVMELVPRLVDDPLFFPTMREMTFTPDGRLWIASKRNLLEVVRKPALHYRQLFPQVRYTSAFVRNREGEVFAITEGGLLRYRQGIWEDTAWPACMLSPLVRTVAIVSENELWIGYRDRDGFTHAMRKGGSEWECQQFVTANGFPGDTQFLAFDSRRRLWRGSEAGLFVARTTPASAHDWIRLGNEVGIPSGEMRQVFHEDPDGTVIVAIGDAFVRIPPRLLDRDPGVPPRVSYLEANGRLTLVPHDLRLRSGDGAQLYLSALPERELAAGAPMEYRFSPAGEWAMVNGHQLSLDDAPEGTGRLELRYSGAAMTLALPFYLEKPWWRTWWFRSLSGSGLLALLSFIGVRAVAALRRWRFRRSKERFLTQHAPMATPASDWPPGTILRGLYRVEGLLARGGFSDVFGAESADGRRVVVKRLRQGDLPVEQLRRRFTQEVAAVSMIRHPGVLPILDTWIDAGGVPHLVLERVEGPTLRQRLAAGRLGKQEARVLLHDLAGILTAAHAQGVVHSDLKPENILLLEGGRPVVIDFGTSALHMQSSLSEYSRPAGSVQYMAPEQLLGRYSRATDVYAFALVALEILTGRRYADLRLPFDATWESALLRAFVEELGLSQEVGRVFADGLRFDPQQRAQDLGEWHSRLESAL